jgi:glycopeptide antibiotics resistance protein
MRDEKGLMLKWFIYVYIAYLILSAAFARKGLAFLNRELGVHTVHDIPWTLFAMALALAIFFTWKHRIPWPGILFVLLSFLGTYFFMRTMHIPEERIHIIHYGFLGFLLVILNREKPLKISFALSLVIVLAVSGADELFQAFLPYRVGELRDVGFGFVGGIWGTMVAALLTGKKRHHSKE